MAPQEAIKDVATELNLNEFTRDNYQFIGWTEDAAGTGLLISDGADYTTETDKKGRQRGEQCAETQ